MTQKPIFEHYLNCCMYMFNTACLTLANEVEKSLHVRDDCSKGVKWTPDLAVRNTERTPADH